MKRFRTHWHSLLATCLLSVHIYGAASAQQPPATTPPGGQLDIQNILGGLNLAPMMMSFGGANGMMTDFTRSTERNLLKRHDVRSELFIDSKQREQITELETTGKQEIQKKMMEAVMQNISSKTDELKTLAEGNSGTPDIGAIKDTINGTFQAMQEVLQTVQNTLDTKDEAILNPKQIKRLKELDLQWRGLLSLSDKKVAELLSVTPEQKQIVDVALKDFQTAQMAALQPVINQVIKMGQAAANSNGQPPRGFDPVDLQKKMQDALESDSIKKARIAQEDKIRASLTADQASIWKKLVGVKFTFRSLD